jgi:hypothetical protein
VLVIFIFKLFSHLGTLTCYLFLASRKKYIGPTTFDTGILCCDGRANDDFDIIN